MEKLRILWSPNQKENLDKQNKLVWNLAKLAVGEDGQVHIFQGAQ